MVDPVHWKRVVRRYGIPHLNDEPARVPTKPVTLDVVLNKIGQNPLDKKNSARLSARGTLKRSDFGMKAFLGPIGDEIDLIVEIEAKQKP